MTHAIAAVELHRGRRDAFLDEFRRFVSQGRNEDGCIEHGLAVDLKIDIAAQIPGRQVVVTVVEEWEVVEHLKRLLDAPKMRELPRSGKDLVAGIKLGILAPE